MRWPIVCLAFVSIVSVSSADYLVLKLDVNKDYVTSLDKDGFLPTVKPPDMQPPDKEVVPLPPSWVHAYIEVRREKDLVVNKSLDVQFPHKWGKKAIVPYDLIDPIKKPTLFEQFEQRKAILRDGKTGARYLELAQWCLAHALDRTFHEMMEEATLVDAVNPTVAAYHKLKALLGKHATADDPSIAGLTEDLKREGYRSMQSPGGYYTLLTNLPPSKQAVDEVKRRLELLDSAFEDFYYWFLFNGKGFVPQIPPYRLTAVLVASPKEFHSKHLVWGSPPLSSDGFTPREDNVIILSSSRLDEPYATLARNTNTQVQALRIPERELLNGDVWDLSKGFINLNDRRQMVQCAYVQSMLLAKKYLEEEHELASTTHHAIRQLLFASGMLPQNVIAPEWLEYGLASCFDCPPGAVYRGVGLPSWSHVPLFKHFRRQKQFGDSKETLLKIVTDGYFRQARKTELRIVPTAPDEMLVRNAKQQRQLAQSSAWAFTYYLIRAGKLPALLRYRDELNRLPRDLELSEQTLEGCFVRAFDLTDPARLQSFADAWYSEAENVHLPVPESEVHTLRPFTSTK